MLMKGKIKFLHKRVPDTLFQEWIKDLQGHTFYTQGHLVGVMTAIRFEESFKLFFERLIANGKQTTQAQIAVMRKMIITAHSLYKNDRKFKEDFNCKVSSMAE